MEADQLPVPFGQEEADRVEPGFLFAQPDLLDPPVPLVRVAGEGSVVRGGPGCLVLAHLEGPQRDPRGQHGLRQLQRQRALHPPQDAGTPKAHLLSEHGSAGVFTVRPQAESSVRTVRQQLGHQRATEAVAAGRRRHRELRAGPLGLVPEVEVCVGPQALIAGDQEMARVLLPAWR
ncbi:MAG TPA: hypothetical protein VNA30_02450 [Mycobacteriales bacterium]|nr:hypothetical protein [Mycobacteriales bacterium]